MRLSLSQSRQDVLPCLLAAHGSRAIFSLLTFRECVLGFFLHVFSSWFARFVPTQRRYLQNSVRLQSNGVFCTLAVQIHLFAFDVNTQFSASIKASMALQTTRLTLSDCSAFCYGVLQSTNHSFLHSYGHSCIATLWLLTALYSIAQFNSF